MGTPGLVQLSTVMWRSMFTGRQEKAPKAWELSLCSKPYGLKTYLLEDKGEKR